MPSIMRGTTSRPLRCSRYAFISVNHTWYLRQVAANPNFVARGQRGSEELPESYLLVKQDNHVIVRTTAIQLWTQLNPNQPMLVTRADSISVYLLHQPLAREPSSILADRGHLRRGAASDRARQVARTYRFGPTSVRVKLSLRGRVRVC